MTSYRLRVSLYPNSPSFEPAEADETIWSEIAVNVTHTLGDLHEAIFAALNVLQRGFAALGLGWPESTPVETALPTATHAVSAKRVVETGSLGA